MEEKTFDINESKALIFEDEEGRFSLSPRGCFASALVDAGIGDAGNAIELSDDPKFDATFNVLVKRFKEHGWIESGGKEPSGTDEKQKDVFVKTVGVYFKNADKDELEAAFDEFMILLEKHGNTKDE
jgi:hypothetical protein